MSEQELGMVVTAIIGAAICLYVIILESISVISTIRLESAQRKSICRELEGKE